MKPDSIAILANLSKDIMRVMQTEPCLQKFGGVEIGRPIQGGGFVLTLIDGDDYLDMGTIDLNQSIESVVAQIRQKV